jgi:hypothetical protein
MNTKTMFTIVALMAAIGMLGVAAAAHVAIPIVPQAMAQGTSAHVLQDDQGEDTGDSNSQGDEGP